MSDDHFSVVRRQPQPKSASWPVVTPIWPSVVYATQDPDSLDEIYEGGAQGYTYGREGHPNWSVLAGKLDRLEEAEGGVVTGSGMAAVTMVLQGVLQAGDHLVAGNQLYGKVLKMLKDELPRQGIDVTFADPTDAQAIARALRANTKLVLVELVSNPTIRVADIEGILAACRDHPALVAADNTFTTPALYRPLTGGCDIVIHSVTKLLAGHSDATLGYAASRDASLNTRFLEVAVSYGLTPSPFDCWLAERGLHSFSLRAERAGANARALADCLAGLSGVEAVLYPTRPDHPDHNRALGLFQGQGGAMLSFRLAGGRPAVSRFLAAAPHIPFAPTLGDVATTLAHPASSSHRGLSEAERAEIGISEGFLRCSVGIEDPELLKREFTAAAAASQK